MQDQRGTLDEGHVPGPRNPADDDDVAVGTAHTDHATGDTHDHDTHEGTHEGTDESYPAGTYASGSAVADTDRDDLADRDDVEVVDHDQALAEEQADERDEERDDERAEADEATDDETADEVEARQENEDRGDTDFVPADVAPQADERDEVEAAAEEEAEDRAWTAEHTDAAGTDVDNTDVDNTDVDSTEAVSTDAEDRAWAAEHATQLRAGSLTEDDTTTADTTDHYDTTTADTTDHYDTADHDTAGTDTADHYDTDSDTADADADAGRYDDTLAEPVAASEALEGGEALDAGDVVAVPVPDGSAQDTAGAGQDLRPGAVEALPVGAIWADGAGDGLRERWRELQLRFIDDPRSVAGEADQLIAEAVSTVTGALESQRAQLSAWQSEGGEDTERLRAAVRQYRDFLNRLLDL
ncbi:hypothetical protein OHA72_20470 [Dactylosporangium sp. NBC_01737]|uniref:hypothetical protein n=1 Tax=Dactylosporangium sp. NBC_01737 TaxID=2975959 RepID=UPI002E110ADA|nr:hypothetical protein OHA72_20470 [Dactylosporangium sp. NBC_01737]